MTWVVNEKEYKSVMALDAKKRYSYLIKRIADYQQVWSLKIRDGWVVMGDDNTNQLFPIWPHRKFAEACSNGIWSEAIPEVIDLDAWMKRWLPGLKKDKRLIAVFPLSDDKSIKVDPDRLKEDIEEELSNIE